MQLGLERIFLVPVTAFGIVIKRVVRLGERPSILHWKSRLEEGGLRFRVRETPGIGYGPRHRKRR
jgi:hypothetical protein